MTFAVASIHVYPLKGGRGIEVSEVLLDEFGPINDRRWMVVDPDGSMVTQREVARLCQVAATPTRAGLILGAPGRQALEIGRPAADAPTREVRVWDDYLAAVDVGADAAGWCTEFLGRDVRLVALAAHANRRTDPEYDPIGSKVGFVDGYPLLVIGQGSLEDLNRRLDVPLPMNRFRPNLVVTGVAPFGEDAWRRITIGTIPFDVVKPCGRCVVTTTDQATAERSIEPLKTLATFRKREKGAMFGMNLVHRATGPIRAGDAISVERTT